MKITLFVVFFTVLVCAQSNRYFQSKEGECPALRNTGICEQICRYDGHCPLQLKCCKTDCGGSICTAPIKESRNKERPGYCPSTEDYWVCSSSCIAGDDNTCRGRKKCCKTEGCGGSICLQPEAEPPTKLLP